MRSDSVFMKPLSLFATAFIFSISDFIFPSVFLDNAFLRVFAHATRKAAPVF
jgi:hypothetical protein